MNDHDVISSTCGSVSVASREEKRQPRGSYNQYLSEPTAKIPRNTLNRWLKKNLANTSISVDETGTDLSNAACSGSSSITADMEPVIAELPCSFDVCFERACFEHPVDECDLAPTANNEQTQEIPSDQCELPDGCLEEIPAATELEKDTIPDAEDEQDVDEYLDAFNCDESADSVNNTDEKVQEQKTSADVPLYSGAPISVAVSMLLIVMFAIRHSLTGLALDLLTLVSLHCALPNQCASSMELLKKFFMQLKNPIQCHYYCTFCMEYQGLSIPEDKLCKNRSCLKDLSEKENSSYFIIIPLVCQLRDLIQRITITDSEGKDLTLRGILLCGTMDAPAKCLMQKFVQFNGFSGCPYCLHRGTSVKTSARGHTHAYPFNRENPLKGYVTERTHENTLQHAYEARKSKLEGKYAPVCGVKGYSWFMFIPGFDIIKGIAVDYMHCVLLGVTKMLTTLWFNKAHAAEDWNVSKRLEAVDRRLLNITPPNCISRPPRRIAKDFAHWKASEFRSFLFFYAIPCLWNILPDEYFQHFILFVEAIWLLDQSSISLHCLQKVRKLLLHFCLRIEALYGCRYEKFNVHCLLHLHDCVKNIGPLWACSCFWLEDYKGDLRKLFHGTQKVELQIAFSVCIQQKIPELIPLLRFGSGSKKFHEHLTCGRYLLKCKREEISDNVFALGVMSPATLSTALMNLIETSWVAFQKLLCSKGFK